MSKIIELPDNLEIPWKEKTIAFDFETTGLKSGKGTKKDDEDNKPDRVIEIGYILFENGKEVSRASQRFNPEGKKSAKAAFNAHGIKDADLLSEPTFKEMAEEIRQIFEEYPVVMGYNIKFDLGFAKAEFKRAGAKEFSWANRLVIDPLEIWKNLANNKKLVTAFSIFLGGKFEGVHAAISDIAATTMVATAMCKTFGIEPRAEAMAENSFPKADTGKSSDSNQFIPGDNRFLWNEKGKVTINFGAKHMNHELQSLAKGAANADVWYLKDFLLVKNFPEEVKEFVQLMLDGKPLPEMRHVTKVGQP